ncbi:penicillin-binding transpeptidase domain-containing protein [Marinactinospora endophytica]
MSPRHLRRFLAATVSAATVTVMAGCAAEPSPEVAVRTFLLDWQAGDYEAAARQTDGDVDSVAAALQQAHDQLDLAALRLGLGPISIDGDTATASFDVQADLGIGDPVWEYEGSMPLSRTSEGWAINWSPAVIHPRLAEGERLAITYDVPDRGQIYDRSEQPLVGETDVIAFGVRPARMDDMEGGIQGLAEILGEDPEPLLNRVRSAPPEEFQPLVLMRAQDVDPSLLSRATGIPGVETSELKMPLAPNMASAIVGEVAGTVEHKVSSRVSGPYQAGDTVGLGGLQSVYQQRLAGSATTKVVTLDERGGETEVLHEWAGQESGSLTTTLDSDVQTAAEGALELLPGSAYLVALDARSGEILGAAGRPDDVDNVGAFTREYHPGEAFTIVSAAALLSSGAVSADQAVTCDAETTIGDRTFTNPGGASLMWGQPDLTRAFANACATTFAGLAAEADPEALNAAAADFGIGGDWQVPVPAYTGEFSPGGGEAGIAAAMVGADGVKVSPLTMATVAAAVAEGTWHAPRLVADEEGAEESPSVELDPAVVESLRAMMRSTVQEGSAAAANIGMVPVHGQVGFAEQEIDGEAGAVQWFVGYQGQVAFAVAVETDPANTYSFAVSAAADFLQRLPYGYVQDTTAQEGSAADAGGVPAVDPVY